ncbi:MULTISPECIES: phage minor head protein [unclassified Moraxella]|uniref:phage head morphogenesis protein n=1 Tax=unclassified Moraxella TaxID=2685852 RepID=UPI003AF5AB78
MPKGLTTGMDFRSPPTDAIHYLQQRYPQASWAYTDLLDNAHDRAFVVAKMMDVDLVSTVQQSLVKAMQDGTTYKAWAKDIDKVLAKAGWYDGQINVDSEGNAKKVATGGQHRLETIYRTNMASAYEAGRQKVIFNEREHDPFPFVMYSAIMDNRTRPTHKALHGKVMAKSDPAWQSISPPNGYNCRCTIVELTQGQIDRYGYTVSSSDGKLSTEVVELPNGNTAQRTLFELDNGAVFKTDVGFNHAPKVLPMQALFDKAILAEPKLATKVLEQTLNNPRVVDDLAKTFRTFASPIVAQIPPPNAPPVVIRNTGAYQHVGALDSQVVTVLETHGINLQTPVLTITDDDVTHAMRTDKHNPVPQSWFLDLPKHLAKPDAVLLDTLQTQPTILLAYVMPNNMCYKVAVKLNYAGKLKVEGKKMKVLRNNVITTQIVAIGNLQQVEYVVLQGKI